LNQYLGANHGVTLGISEYGFTHNNSNISSVSYASLLGTFADNGVGFLSPWYWNTGMWETMHLFSRYAKTTRVKSISNQELNVSGYTSVNTTNDSMTVILVNRHLTAIKTVSMSISNFAIPNGAYTTKQLNALPSSETFISHTNNALASGTIALSANTFTINLPALSTTAIILKGAGIATPISETMATHLNIKLFPNPSSSENTVIDLSSENILDVKMEIYNALGQRVYIKQFSGQNPSLMEIPSSTFEQGVYAVTLSNAKGKVWSSWLVKM
jgi:hypothetical protein